MRTILRQVLSGLVLLNLTSMVLASENVANLSPAEIERRLPTEHPSTYYLYAQKLWASGRKDDAVFWFYAGQLRYRFHLLANPGLEESGDPALFGAFQSQIGQPINLYAGSDPDKWIRQINKVLKWDEETPNGFTSKNDNKIALSEVRAGLLKLRDYIDKNRNELRAQREQHGIGQIGVVDGVYVEERKERMPQDWPPLRPQTSLAMMSGTYEASFEALLGPIFFFKDQHRLLHAKSFVLSATEKNDLLVIAMNGDKELLRRVIQVRSEDGAVVFDENKNAQETGLAEGGEKNRIYLRLNSNSDLVIQRDIVGEGRDKNKGPVKFTYTFWNRANRLAVK